MGLSRSSSDAAYLNFVAKSVPYADLASGIFLFGRNATESLRNRAPNAAVAAGTLFGPGTPTYGRAYIEFALPALTVGSSIDTGITPNPASDFTYIACCIANAQVICGTWHDGVNSNFLGAGGVSQIQSTLNGANSQFTTQTSAANKMQFFAFKRSATERAVYINTGSAMVKESGAPSAGGTANGYRIGPIGGVGPQVAATLHRHAANLIFPIALSDSQIQEEYDALKFNLLKRGIALL